MSHHGHSGGLTLDWQLGFSLTEGANSAVVWQYKFSQLRGSSDDGKSKLKLHFHDHETRSIDTKVIFIKYYAEYLKSILSCSYSFKGNRMPSPPEPVILHACILNR